jgi:hypothetical protein
MLQHALSDRLHWDNIELCRSCLTVFIRCCRAEPEWIDGSDVFGTVCCLASAADFNTKREACAAMLELAEMCPLDLLDVLIEHDTIEILCEFVTAEFGNLIPRCLEAIADLVSKVAMIFPEDWGRAANALDLLSSIADKDDGPIGSQIGVIIETISPVAGRLGLDS